MISSVNNIICIFQIRACRQELQHEWASDQKFEFCITQLHTKNRRNYYIMKNVKPIFNMFPEWRSTHFLLTNRSCQAVFLSLLLPTTLWNKTVVHLNTNNVAAVAKYGGKFVVAANYFFSMHMSHLFSILQLVIIFNYQITILLFSVIIIRTWMCFNHVVSIFTWQD